MTCGKCFSGNMECVVDNYPDYELWVCLDCGDEWELV